MKSVAEKLCAVGKWLVKILLKPKVQSLECTKVLQKIMLLPMLMFCGSKTIVYNMKYRLKVQKIQMDNIRGLLGEKITGKIRKENIRKMCSV